MKKFVAMLLAAVLLLSVVSTTALAEKGPKGMPELKHEQKLEKKADKQAEKELKKLREEALALLAEGKLVLTKTELLELKEDFEKVTENTGYDAVLALLRTFYKLGETQQLALENSDEVKLAQKIVAKHNHTNAYTGVKVDGLEWNIRLVVEETDNETALNDIKAKLENSDILTIWDIYLEDVLTGKKYKPEESPLTSAFGVLYACSGYFIAYYWNVMWIDSFYLFPLVMLGIDKIIKERKASASLLQRKLR